MTEQTEGTPLVTVAEAAERRSMDEPMYPLPAPVDRGDALMKIIQRTTDPEMVSKFLDVYERWDRENARKEYIGALARAQGTMPVVKKNAHVFFEGKGGKTDTDYWHADYGGLVQTITPHLSREGFSYDHEIERREGRIYVTCILSHDAGHTKSVTLDGAPDDTGGKNAIQQSKSTVTYLKRTTLEAVSGVATEGDDNDGRGDLEGVAVELASEEQIKALREKIVALGREEGPILKFYDVESLEDMSVDIYARALHNVNKAITSRDNAVREAVEAENEREV